MKITVKESWDEITLEDYDWIKSILKLDSTQHNKELLRIVSDLSEEKINELSTLVVNKLVSRCDFLQDKPTPSKLKNMYVIDGKEYKLNLAIGELPTSAFIDLCEYSNDPDRLSLAISTLMIPLSDAKERIELSDKIYKELSVTDAMGISIFFYQLLETFSRTIHLSSHSS